MKVKCQDFHVESQSRPKSLTCEDKTNSRRDFGVEG